MRPKVPSVPQRIPWKTVATTPDSFSLTGKSLAYTGTNAGTEYIDTTYYVAGYKLANSYGNYAIGVVPLPSNWGGKYTRMSAVWLPAGTAAGTVYFSWGVIRLRDGTALTSNILSTGVYDAASGGTTTPVVSYHEFGTALPTDIGNNEYVGLKVRRNADLAGDTYENDIYLMGVTFEVR
jgi:hypothetical protein